MSNIIWIIVIGFVAGIIARFLSPGPNEPSGFILTTLLGIAGAFLATFIGQTIGWYRLDQGAGLISATVGALIVLFIWNRLVVHHVVSDPGGSGSTPGRPTGRNGGAFLRPRNQRFTALPPCSGGAQTVETTRRQIWDCAIFSPECRTAPAANPSPAAAAVAAACRRS